MTPIKNLPAEKIADNISTIESVKEFFAMCVNDLALGYGFHPDTEFQDYMDNISRKRFFNVADATSLNNAMEKAFEVCRSQKTDIYSLAVDAVGIH